MILFLGNPDLFYSKSWDFNDDDIGAHYGGILFLLLIQADFD